MARVSGQDSNREEKRQNSHCDDKTIEHTHSANALR